MDFYLPSGSSSSGSSSSGSSSVGSGGSAGTNAVVAMQASMAASNAARSALTEPLNTYSNNVAKLFSDPSVAQSQKDALLATYRAYSDVIINGVNNPGATVKEKQAYYDAMKVLNDYVTNPNTIPGWTTQDDVLASGNSGSWINADGTAGKTMVNAAKPEATTGGMLPPADMVFTDPTPEEAPPSDLPTGWKDGYTEDPTTGGPGLPIVPVAPADKLNVGLLGLDFTKPLNWKTDNFNTPYPSLSSLNTQTAQQTKPTTEKQDQFQWQRQDAPESAKFGTDYLKNYAESNKNNLAWQAYA